MKTQVCSSVLMFAVLSVLSAAGRGDEPAPAEEPIPPEIVEAAKEVGRRQATGLDGAAVVVHRAFDYQQECPFEPADGFKLIAVDVEFTRFNEHFDLDDVDIVDSATERNFGSNPYARLLKANGLLEPNAAAWEAEQESLRTLLVYSVPKDVAEVKLEYWGRKLTPDPTPLGKGRLLRDDSLLLAAAKFWPFPRGGLHYGDSWQHGRWLVLTASSPYGAFVCDLHAETPTMEFWPCSVLRALQPDGKGGWWVISRTGNTAENIRFRLWHHPAGRPGEHEMDADRNWVSPGEHLQGLAVLDGEVFVWEDTACYRWTQTGLKNVDELPTPKGVSTDFGQDYTHGVLQVADGPRLVWDGDAFIRRKGRFEKSWKMGIDENYEFATVPDAASGVYYLQDREVFLVEPGGKPQPVMRGVENVMTLSAGPKGSLQFSLGNNAPGIVVGIWYPEDDTYRTLRVEQLSDRLTTTDVETIHFSETTKTYYIASRGGLFTLPESELLKLPRQKQPAH